MKILKKVSVVGISVGVLFSIGIINANVVNASNMPTPISINYEIKEFKDLPRTHWSHASVHWGVERNLVSGYTDGTYKPSAPITEEEFVRVLASFVKLDVKETEYWSQKYYDSLNKYALPIKGHSDKVAKKTGLSRGQIARIIAAKNGFNLDERQAIYYMYENDISNGMITGTMTFDSYGKDDSVTRAQIPAFFQRLEEKGHTTFMGKPSPVKDGNGIGGINGVPKDNTVITDKDFDDLTPEGGVNAGGVGDNFVPSKGDFSKFDPVANKHGLRLDSYSNGFSLKDDSSKTDKITYEDTDYSGILIEVQNYKANKDLLADLLKQTGNFNDTDVNKIYDIIENMHGKILVPDTYKVNDNYGVYTMGAIDGSTSSGLRLQFGRN